MNYPIYKLIPKVCPSKQEYRCDYTHNAPHPKFSFSEKLQTSRAPSYGFAYHSINDFDIDGLHHETAGNEYDAPEEYWT